MGKSEEKSVDIDVDPHQAGILVYHNGVPTAHTLFDYYYITENGIKQDVTGKIRNVGVENVAVMQGKYHYTGPDNTLYKVVWYADETGFHPSGDHIH